MKIHYISPSLLPSRTANSIHVMNQCKGFCQNQYQVFLYALSSKRFVDENEIKKFYNIRNKNLKIKYAYNFIKKAENLQILFIFIFNIFSVKKDDLILSRNLYASFFITFFLKKNSLYETHQIEKGIKGFMQKMIIKSEKTKTILISRALETLLNSRYETKFKKCFICHDAAPKNIRPIPISEKKRELSKLINYEVGKNQFVCGYFGHLYKGRGIEIIKELAKYMPNFMFLIIGGNNKELEIERNKNLTNNIHFMGYMENYKCIKLMCCMDALLMPYQKKVFLANGYDTSQWMSPMKMFEYLASGVPILSSDLPVLREVLRDGENSFLLDPENLIEWIEKLNYLKNNPNKGIEIGNKAKEEYKNLYTWDKRAKQLINIFIRN